jgi:hypothetical protein
MAQQMTGDVEKSERDGDQLLAAGGVLVFSEVALSLSLSAK